ncbi:hypothetical protein SCLARK_00279 [Spiroplasma clarkii]|uniref:Uncharacterized protein n=1 Tax=Spiroplasma clarkii TaxID=2139 RepID=A0A1Y0KZ66_9MOLU|nr:hypothetical protein [Spiroplasma clarkii]ARU91036.1 hypothetical protein SCLARK_00279 [Spiroplasma clarkii]ATX70474.1 hypothetical protein SCLAR_v1c01430 [Spiroplasma clarkii]
MAGAENIEIVSSSEDKTAIVTILNYENLGEISVGSLSMFIASAEYDDNGVITITAGFSTGDAEIVVQSSLDEVENVSFNVKVI